MRYLWLLSLLLFALPPAAYATGAQDPQSVEEPDAPDEDSDMQDVPEAETPPLPDAGGVVAAPKPETRPEGKKEEEGDSHYDRVILRGLNKVTARAQTIDAPIGSVERFGTIEIVAHSCWKAAPEERPENAALLEISEIKQGEAPTRIFLGWMFSSSPGLSALEHPFYDITVVKCEKTEAPPPPAAPEKPHAKKSSGKRRP